MQGDGFFSLSIGHSIEARMQLSFRIRTLSSDAVVLYSKGIHDFHLIEVREFSCHSRPPYNSCSFQLIGGKVEYRWEAGLGEGVVRSKSEVCL